MSGRSRASIASTFPTRIAAEVKDFDVSKYLSAKEARRYDTFIHYGLVATMEAVRDAGLESYAGDRERVGVCIGSGIGGLPMIEETKADVSWTAACARSRRSSCPARSSTWSPGLASIHYGFEGPNMAIVSACSTANHSLGEAAA